MYLIIFISLVLVVLAGYFGKVAIQYTNLPETKMIINWVVLLCVINIFITAFIFITYTTIKFKKGPHGPRGRRGKDGGQGRDGSCVMCTPALTGLKSIRPSNSVDRIDPMLPSEEKKLFTVNRK